MRLAFIEPSGAEPVSETVVNEHFHSVAPTVSKQIRTMRFGGAEHGHHPGKRLVRPRTHIQRLSRQPDSIDADHRTKACKKAAQEVGSLEGHSITTAPP